MNKKKARLSILLGISLFVNSFLMPVFVSAHEISEENKSASSTWEEFTQKAASVTDIKEYEENELLVVYKKEGAEAKDLPESAKQEPVTENCTLIEVDTKKDLRKAITCLEKDENVGYIQPNYEYRALYTKDKYSDKQWFYYGDYNIGMESAWEKGTGANEEVIVAIIDVGVDYNHEDLREAMWINEDEIPDDEEDNDGNGYEDDIYGYNFFDDNGVVCDYFYSEVDKEYVEDHGTHVAGIIAATADNEVGIAGIASRNNVKIMSLKALGDDQNGFGIMGYTDTLLKSIQYAQDNGAAICNMSLGYTSFDKALYQAMEESSMLFVCAAGNGMESTGWKGWSIDEDPEYPAAFDLDNIISVANMNEFGRIDESSCYGSRSVDIAAPGTEIVSSVVAPPNINLEKYAYFTGTSMAAPMVAGTAALAASYYGNLTNLQIKEAVLSGSFVNESFAGKVAGNRMLNVYGVLEYYKGRAVITTEVENVSNTSNNKRVTAYINGLGSPVKMAAYAKGKQTAEYFNGEEGYTLLEIKENKVSFKVRDTDTYTIYTETEEGIGTVAYVEAEVPVVEELELSAARKTLKKGKTYQLKAKASPKDMYVKLVYKTSNSKVAVVNSKGKITAKKKGTAQITVYAKDGNTIKKAVCKIKVNN